METIRLRTFGGARLETLSGAPVASLRPRELALLAYIARQPGQRIEREVLAAAFWGGRAESRARHSLRQVLFRLRRALGPTLIVTSTAVELAAGAVLLDAVEFEASVAADRLADAVALYRDEFLKGAEAAGDEGYRAWLESERARFARLYVFALERLTESAAQQGDWPEVERWASRWSSACPLDEPPVRRWLEALQRQGRRSEAIALRDAATDRLRDELGREASPDLLADATSGPETTKRRPTSAALLGPDLVGRDAPLATLEALWRSIGERGAVVLVDGEMGIGKTRLAREFARRAANATGGFVLLGVRAEVDQPDVPLAAAARLLAPLRQARGLSGASDRALARLATLLPSLRERFPRLAEMEASSDGLAEAVREVIEAVAAEQPVLVVADDFPRLDRATRELVLSLVREPPAALLILLAGRSDELRALGRLDDVQDSPLVARIKLQPLSLAQTERLVTSMVELSSPQDRDTLVGRIHAESGGLPFYAVELVSGLADSGILALDAAGRWRLATGLTDESLPLPASVDLAIQHRLQMLTPWARTTLEAAAVLGRRADASVLEAVAGVPAEALVTAAAELVARRLLYSVSQPRPAYEFAHELIRRAAYQHMPASRRASLHLAASHALEPLLSENPDVRREIAYHRARARGGRDLVPTRRRWLLASSVTLVLAASTAGVAFWPRASLHASDAETRLVVLPFENLSGESELRGVSRIAADWISQAVARSTLIRVAPPAEEAVGARSLLGRFERAIEHPQGVQTHFVIRGSYRRAGDSLRITGEVVDARSRRVLGVVGPLSANPVDPMPAIDTLAERMLGLLSSWLDPRVAAGAAFQSNAPDYAAYRAFAEGLDHFYARRGELALPHFLRAYALDSTYTLPLLYAVLVHEGHSNLAAADSLLRILQPRRGELAPYDRAVFDYQVAMVQRDWPRMYAAAERAADIAPESLMAVDHLPRMALALNRPRRAVELLDRVDPARGAARGLASYWLLLAHALHMVGDYERQLAVALEVRERLPQEHRALFYQARALAALGRIEELDVVLNESWLLASIPGWGPPGLPLHTITAQELAAHGSREPARLVLERAVSVYDASQTQLMQIPRHAFELARAFYLLDRLDEARVIFESLSTNPEFGVEAWSYLGCIAIMQGDAARAAAAEQLLEAAPAHYVSGSGGSNPVHLARMAALRGEREMAVRLLRRATASGLSYGIGSHLIWEFASLRGYAPFEEWLQPKR